MNKFLLLSSVSMLSLASFNVNAMMTLPPGGTAPAPAPATPAAPAAPTPLTSGQLSTIYSALVSQGIAAGILPANFKSLVSANYDLSVNTGLVSYTQTPGGGAPAVINIGNGIYTTAEAQMLIAHAIGVSLLQTQQKAAIGTQSAYGNYATQTISAINALETAADKIGAQLIGAQNFINGLSAMEANETSSSNALTLFARAIAVAQANPGTAFTIPANIIPGGLFSGQTANAAATLEYTLVNGVPTLNAAASSAQAAQLVSADATDIGNAVNGYTTSTKTAVPPNPAVGELNQGGSDLVALGIAAKAPPLTPMQISSIYSALVHQGIAAGILPANFTSLVTTNFTGNAVSGLVSYTAAANGNPAVITTGTGINSTAEAQMLLAHAIGVAQNQALYNAASQTMTWSGSSQTDQGINSESAVSAVNKLEFAADAFGAKLIGVQNYINGLAAMVANENWSPAGVPPTGIVPGGQTQAPPSELPDAVSAFLRVNQLAEANPGTTFSVPWNIADGQLTYNSLPLEYTMVNGVSTLNTTLPTSGTGNTTAALAVQNASYSQLIWLNRGDFTVAELNGGASDLVGLGLEASQQAPLAASQISADYSALVAKGAIIGIQPSTFNVSFSVSAAPGLVSYTPAANGVSASIQAGGSITSSAEEQMLLAHALGVAQSQTLEAAAAAAVTRYGIDSPQAIKAVNAVEANADLLGSQLIGAQNYINGLAAMENSEIEQDGNGAGPGDGATLYARAWAIAQFNPGALLIIPANLSPNPGLGSSDQVVQFDTVSGSEVLNKNFSSPTAQGLEDEASSTITSQTTAGNTAAEYNLGGRDLLNVGAAAPAASLTSAQLASVYGGLVTKAIAAKLLPANFSAATRLVFSSTPVTGMVAYTPATSTTGATLQIGSGISSVAEAQMLIAHELGIAQNQALETAATSAATTYGIDAKQTIAAVNALETAADQTGATLAGAQTYVNGLSTMENNELAAAANGTAAYPTDADTLFNRVQLIAQENPGTDLTIAPNLAPTGATVSAPLSMEYTGSGSSETLNTTASSSQDAGLIAHDQLTLTQQANTGDAPDAEDESGGQDVQGAGANAKITGLAQLQTLANQEIQAGITDGIFPVGFDPTIYAINQPGDSSYANADGVYMNLAYVTTVSDAQFWLGHEMTHTTQDGAETPANEAAADVGGVELLAATNNESLSDAAQQGITAIDNLYDYLDAGQTGIDAPNNADDPDHGGTELDRSVTLLNNLSVDNPGDPITVQIPDNMLPTLTTDEDGNVVPTSGALDNPGCASLNCAGLVVTAISVDGGPAQDSLPTESSPALTAIIEQAADPVYDPNGGSGSGSGSGDGSGNGGGSGGGGEGDGNDGGGGGDGNDGGDGDEGDGDGGSGGDGNGDY